MLALAREMSTIAKVWVCAPDAQQSATGHSLTVRHPLEVHEIAMEGTQKAWHVNGKPADCVKIAFLTLVQEPIDLVLSGINEGSNCGTDTLYSATVAGAMEGALNGAPSMALSLCLFGENKEEIDFGPSARIARMLVQAWQAGWLAIPPMAMLNVNIPDKPDGERKGYKLARTGVQHYSDVYELVEETEAYRQYHLHGERIPSEEDDLAIDLVAVAEGYVTLTPMTADRTNHTLLREMEKDWRL